MAMGCCTVLILNAPWSKIKKSYHLGRTNEKIERKFKRLNRQLWGLLHINLKYMFVRLALPLRTSVRTIYLQILYYLLADRQVRVLRPHDALAWLAPPSGKRCLASSAISATRYSLLTDPQELYASEYVREHSMHKCWLWLFFRIKHMHPRVSEGDTVQNLRSG